MDTVAISNLNLYAYNVLLYAVCNNVAFITTLPVHRMLATNHEAVPTPVPTQVQLSGWPP